MTSLHESQKSSPVIGEKENDVLEAHTIEEDDMGETIPTLSTSALGDASSQQPPLHREYPATEHALIDRMQAQSNFEDHPENKDVDIDEMIRNYRAKKKRETTNSMLTSLLLLQIKGGILIKY